MLETKKCLVCGKEFTRQKRRSYKWWRTAKYCSRKCYVKSRIGLPRHVSEETKRKISKTLTGRKQSKETIEKRRKKMIGHPFWGLQKQPKWMIERRLKFGSENNQWKENPSYSTLHDWVRRHKGKPKKCEFCGKTEGMLHWANISGEYKRDVDDYMSLCVSCHRKYDGSAYKMWETRRKKQFYNHL